MATAANFAATPRASGATVSTANTNIDGTGTLATIIASGTNGSRLDSLQIKGRVAEGTTQAADTIRLFLDDGTNKHPLREITVPAGSGNVSVSVPNFETIIAFGFSIPNGWSLKASTHTGGGTASYELTAFGGDY